MGSLLFTAPPSSRSLCSAIKNVLVLRGGALGDFILTLPIIRSLRREFSSVNVVANRKFAELGADSAFALDDLDLAPFFAANSVLPERWRKYLRKHHIVLSYLHDPAGIFEHNVRACGVGKFIAGPYRFEEGAHMTEQLARSLAPLGIAVTDFASRIELSAMERKEVSARYGQPLVALHPGSGSAHKNWPIENWIALIDELIAAATVVVIGGEADEREVARIRERFDDRVRYAINWPLRMLAALLSVAKFVGHDSGISHLAAAAGARCTILYGPTDPEIWAPRNQNVQVLIAPGKDLRRLGVAPVRAAILPASP
jgi:heptosyltransferase III